MSTEPTHFLTLMNNDKAFSSLDGMACSYQCSDQFQFLPGHWQAKVLDFLRPSKKPANLFKNNLDNTRNNMKSQIQKKEEKKEWWNCGFTNTNSFLQKSFSWGDKNFFGQKNYGQVILKWRNNDQIMPRFERSFITNDNYIFQ